MIPKIIHRVWVGGDMPDHLAAYGETWAEHHPSWEMRMWTEKTMPPLRNWDLWNRAHRISPRNVGQFRADIARYELLYMYGGVYVDCDFEAKRPLVGLTEGLDAWAAWESDGKWVNNAILGSVPGHPFFDRLIDGLPASVRGHPGARPNVVSGPQYLTKLWKRSDPRPHVFPSRMFYPYLFDELHRQGEEFPDAYGVHHWDNRRRRS